jgi:hypothetical protein
MSGRIHEEIARSLRGMCIRNTVDILKLDVIISKNHYSSRNHYITTTSFLLLEYL